MLGFELIFGDAMDQLIEWMYGQTVGFFSAFFALLGDMGAELFDISAIQSILLFFSYLAWTLYVVGLVVAVFETAIAYQNGHGNISGLGLNAIKGFMAVSILTTMPVELYKLSVNLQETIIAGITGYGTGLTEILDNMVISFGTTTAEGMASAMFDSLSYAATPFVILFLIIMFGYAVLKVFFANLKRGGILLIQICVGSLYVFSIPRGNVDGYIGWCKKIIALCLTTFLQTTILTLGMLILLDSPIIGIGLMLSAGEVPRIAETFGLDTSMKSPIMPAIHATHTIVNTSTSIAKAVAK
ncbi:MAG: DUF6045 family protein [Eubacteriales bacterium]